LAGVLLGVGAAAKLYPLLLLGVLFVLCLRTAKMKEWQRTTVAALGTWLVINVPIAWQYPTGWWEFFRRNTIRPADTDSIWNVVADVTNPSDVASLRASVEEKLGPVDILAAFAGGNPSRPRPLVEVDLAEWEAALLGNVTSTFLTVKEFLPEMIARGRGSIVTMSSSASRQPTVHSPGPYAVVERGARIAAGARVFPYCYVGENCVVGPDTVLYPHVVLYQDVHVGARCVVHAHAVLGADGFGFMWDGSRHVKIEQVGGVWIGDD
ncbi:SDR family NAD(P)-dependent oxidoreductase, partial [Kibdelosporangium lantanae]